MPGSGTILTGAIAGVGVEDRPELLLFMNVLTEDTCKALSRMIGDKTETIVEDNISNTPLFTGNFSNIDTSSLWNRTDKHPFMVNVNFVISKLHQDGCQKVFIIL